MRRLRPRISRVLLLLAAALGIVTTLALRDHLEALEARTSAPPPGEPVVVSAVAVGRGEPFVPGSLTVREIPAAYVPPGALRSIADVLGRLAATDVVAGEPVTLARLAPPGGPIAAIVPPGLRAVTVTVAAPPGSIAGGDRVDLLATYATGRPHTETVVDAVEVLRVLETETLEQGAATALVLLVTPETAERVAYARAFADLSVSIVSADAPDST